MIVDERIYTLHPGKTAEYLKLYEAKGMPVQVRVPGNMLGPGRSAQPPTEATGCP